MDEGSLNKGAKRGGGATQIGQPGGPPTGRPKGSKGKAGHEVVNDIIETYRQLGGVAWLKTLAKSQPKTFARLIERIIPKNIELSGDLVLTADKYILDLMRRRREAKEGATGK